MANSSLPHNFNSGLTPGGERGVPYGVYYKLIPKHGPSGSHVIRSPIYLPVTDTISWSFQHTWTEADNLTKNLIRSAASGAMGALTNNKFLTGAADFAGTVAQRKLGGGAHVSACSIYMDSAPPTINVKTKLFSQDGNGSIIGFLESMRADTHADLGGGGVQQKINSLGGGVGSSVQSAIGAAQTGVNQLGGTGNAVKMGLVDHPEWWKIQVISFAGGNRTVIASMEDMICTGLDYTLYAPFVVGEGGTSEPLMAEIAIAFKHGFRGLRESMSFGAE